MKDPAISNSPREPDGMSGGLMRRWLCLQLGSREHYAIPRVLLKEGRLGGLLTDTWIPRVVAPVARRLHRSLGQRRHEDIADRFVRSATLQRLAWDACSRLSGMGYWTAILERNTWFQSWAARQICSWDKIQEAVACFSYSYTARLPFKEAKRRGMRCVLGQIDPGPGEERTVKERAAGYAALEIREISSPPTRYWDEWREEVELADVILVNSKWSAKLLAKAGVPSEKLREVPLAYEAQPGVEGRESGEREAKSDASFAKGHPFRVLFLGQIILRKGIGQLFDAIRRMRGETVDFTFAGPVGVRIPDDILALPNVHFLGPVDRVTAGRLYRESDVFLFPTLSDGFGLTQLEALGHGLPVIASTHCGKVVEHGVTGLVLSEVSPESIVDAAMRLKNDRYLLAQLKSAAKVPDRFHLRHLAPALLTLES